MAVPEMVNRPSRHQVVAEEEAVAEDAHVADAGPLNNNNNNPVVGEAADKVVEATNRFLNHK